MDGFVKVSKKDFAKVSKIYLDTELKNNFIWIIKIIM